MTIQHMEHLISDIWHIDFRKITQERTHYDETLDIIIHEHLHFWKVSARYVPRQLPAFDHER